MTNMTKTKPETKNNINIMKDSVINDNCKLKILEKAFKNQ